MVSLKVTKQTNFAEVEAFHQATGLVLRKYGTHAEASVRVDYGDTIHAEGGKVLVEKGKADG